MIWFLSYKTQKKLASLLVRSNVTTPTRIHYRPAFALSSILYPPEISVCVASDKLKSIRPLSDSVGLTLLYRLVVCSLLGAIYSVMEVMFTRFIEPEAINPIHLPFGQSP